MDSKFSLIVVIMICNVGSIADPITNSTKMMLLRKLPIRILNVSLV